MSVLDYVKDIYENPTKYNKFWVALAAAILSLLTSYFPDQQWLPVVVTFAGSSGVFMVPNKKGV